MSGLSTSCRNKRRSVMCLIMTLRRGGCEAGQRAGVDILKRSDGGDDLRDALGRENGSGERREFFRELLRREWITGTAWSFQHFAGEAAAVLGDELHPRVMPRRVTAGVVFGVGLDRDALDHLDRRRIGQAIFAELI